MGRCNTRPIQLLKMRLFLLLYLYTLFVNAEKHCKKQGVKKKKLAVTSNPIRCVCGWDHKWDRSESTDDVSGMKGISQLHFQCTPLPGTPLKSYCDTTGVCRKRLVKIPWRKVNVYYDCVSVKQLEEVIIYNKLLHTVPVYCTTEKWWNSAVGCCRSGDFCNENLNISIGGIYANRIFLDYPIPLIHTDEDEPGAKGISWKFPCDSPSQCAGDNTAGIRRFCVPSWIPEIRQVRNVCCSTPLGENTHGGKSDKACCGTFIECVNPIIQNNYQSTCKCRLQPGLKLDGSPCVTDSECVHDSCTFGTATNAGTCCTVKEFGVFCSPQLNILCCYGRLCENNRCVDPNMAVTTTMKPLVAAGPYCRLPLAANQQIRCSCGEYRVVDGAVIITARYEKHGCAYLPNDNKNGYCDTNGLCRVSAEKKNGKLTIDMDCVKAENSGPVSNDYHPYNAFSRYYLSECSTATDTWWESAVGCCRDVAFCNKHLRVEIGGVLANSLFLATSYPVPLVYNTSTSGMRQAALIRFGYPCETKDQCAVHPYFEFRYCEPKWIVELKRLQSVCCAIPNYGKGPHVDLLVVPIAPWFGAEACCGSYRVCEPTRENRCKCSKSTLKFEKRQSCESDASWICSLTRRSAALQLVLENSATSWPGCVKSSLETTTAATTRPGPVLKKDGDQCYSAWGRECQGGICYLESDSTKQMLGHEKMYCCSRMNRASCTFNRQCCGDAQCRDGVCRCYWISDNEWYQAWSHNPWSRWHEEDKRVLEACSDEIARTRFRNITAGFMYCPSKEVANLRLTDPSSCPYPQDIGQYQRCTEHKTFRQHSVGYLGCLGSLSRNGQTMWIMNQSVEFFPMNPLICIRYCNTREIPYKFAGIHGESCGCANHIYTNNAHPIYKTHYCSWMCGWNAQDMECGGPQRHFSVYCTAP